MAERKGHFGCLGELSTPPFQRVVKVSFLPLLPTPTPTLWTYNSCQNANTALKFVIIVGVETSWYLIKMTKVTVEHKQLEVLTAKHGRSLRLLCIVGGDQAKLNGVQKSQLPWRGWKLVVNKAVGGSVSYIKITKI